MYLSKNLETGFGFDTSYLFIALEVVLCLVGFVIFFCVLYCCFHCVFEWWYSDRDHVERVPLITARTQERTGDQPKPPTANGLISSPIDITNDEERTPLADD